MNEKRLYVLGGDYSNEAQTFDFLVTSEENPPAPGSEVIIDRTVILRLLEKGYCLEVARPMGNRIDLVIVAGQSYLRTDRQEIAADYIEGLDITLTK